MLFLMLFFEFTVPIFRGLFKFLVRFFGKFLRFENRSFSSIWSAGAVFFGARSLDFSPIFLVYVFPSLYMCFIQIRGVIGLGIASIFSPIDTQLLEVVLVVGSGAMANVFAHVNAQVDPKTMWKSFLTVEFGGLVARFPI
jgi:hypothetical protein